MIMQSGWKHPKTQREQFLCKIAPNFETMLNIEPNDTNKALTKSFKRSFVWTYHDILRLLQFVFDGPCGPGLMYSTMGVGSSGLGLEGIF